jgi:ABC-type multidrug transport system fused ATPase/permease subunit
LNTITDSDRVLVLSDGAVGEFDTPAALASADGSLFGALLRETASGVVTAPSSS